MARGARERVGARWREREDGGGEVG